MYDERMIDELLTEYYDRSLLAIDNTPVHKFSRRHNRAMKRIFKLYENNTAPLRKTAPDPLTDTGTGRNIRHKRILVVTVIVFLALLTGFTVARHFLSNSFKGGVFKDNTQMFAINTENCPVTIEKKYSPTYLPVGFEQTERHSLSTLETVIYTNSDNNSIMFNQCVKSEYDVHLNTEHDKIEITEINGFECLIVAHTKNSEDFIEMVLDGVEYIFDFVGNITKEEAIKIAESLALENTVN